MPNYNPTTGHSFGVIAFNKLADWAYDDLWYGPNARDLSWEEALEGLKAEAKAAWAEQLEEAEIAANETDPNMSEEDFQSFIGRFMEEALGDDDEEAFVADYIERNHDNIQIDEPVIEGTCDGVSYRISWLGGAPLLWSFDGPVGRVNSLCSPCVPGAGDLGSGFTLGAEGDGYLCHCVPLNWLRSTTVEE